MSTSRHAKSLVIVALVAFLMFSSVIRAYIVGSEPYWIRTGNPMASMHEFQVVRDVGAHAHVFNLRVDGKEWKYLAYDSDQEGVQIRLYLSNDMINWVPYSKNPILSGSGLFRWPSTIYYNGTFYMFVDERKNSDIVLYTSFDGVHYHKKMVILRGNTTTNNPDIYLNPNDGRFYLYNHQGGGVISVKESSSLLGLANAKNVPLFTGAAAPCVFYYQGTYYMLVEKGNYSDGWYVEEYISSSPLSGFRDYGSVTLESEDEACPTIAYDNFGHYFLFTDHYYGHGRDLTKWELRERAYFTS